MLRAYNDGMNVITMSLGATHGWSFSVTSALADRIAQRGRVGYLLVLDVAVADSSADCHRRSR